MTSKKALLPLVAALGLSACVEYGVVPLSQFEPFRAEAEKGDAFAQAQLGQYYLGGPDNEEDLEMAVYWLERAAGQNEPQAIYILGAMRERGHGFDKGVNAAHEFYMRAAMLNNGPAQEALARIYALGLVGPVDNVASHKWQILSEQHGRKLRPIDFMARRKLSEGEVKLAEAEADKISDSF